MILSFPPAAAGGTLRGVPCRASPLDGRGLDTPAGISHAQSLPWGEGAPVRTLGRMRGRFGTQPFFVEKGGSSVAPAGFFRPAGQVDRPHPSPFGDSFPQGSPTEACYTKKASQIRYADGHRNSPLPEHCAPPRQNQRVATSGHKKGVQGQGPPALLLPAFSGSGPRPESGGSPRRRSGTCDGPNGNRLPTTGPHPHQENFPARRRGKKVQSCFDRLCRAKHTAQPPVCFAGQRAAAAIP